MENAAVNLYPNVPDYVHKLAIAVRPVGSRVTCDPPPTDTDEDYLVLLMSNKDIGGRLGDDGWSLDGSFISDEVNRTEPEHRFTSWSRDGINLIVTRNFIFFQRFMAASSIAKRFNLLKKEDRIALFQAVLYANEAIDTSLIPATEAVEF